MISYAMLLGSIGLYAVGAYLFFFVQAFRRICREQKERRS